MDISEHSDSQLLSPGAASADRDSDSERDCRIIPPEKGKYTLFVQVVQVAPVTRVPQCFDANDRQC